MTVNINAENFNKEVLEAKGLVLVDFYSDTCGPCKRLAPILEEISEDFKDNLKVVKININDNNEIAYKMGIMSVPTLVFYRDGEIAHSSVGLMPKDELSKSINELLQG